MCNCRPEIRSIARLLADFVIGLLLFLGADFLDENSQIVLAATAETRESHTATKSEISFLFDGKTYQALLYIPQNNNNSKSYPLLIATPGIGDRLLRYIRVTDFARMAGLHGFIVAFPQIEQYQDWPEFLNPSGNSNQAALFFRSIIASASKVANIQSSNIYLTGFSTGGMIVLAAMCDMSNEVAAFGIVSASLPRAWQSECRMKRAVPAIFFASRSDPILPWDGGRFSIPLAQTPSMDVLPIDDTVALWRQNNRCNPRPLLEPMANVDPSDSTTVTRLKYDFECRNDAQVLLYAITGGGHTWPGSVAKLRSFEGAISQDISASNSIWEFVRRYNLGQ